MRFTLRTALLTITVASVAGLAGCYTADSELIPDADTVTPYARITFKTDDNSDSKTDVLVRTGAEYVEHNDDGDLSVRFKALDQPDWYVAEMVAHAQDAAVPRLFGVVHVDPAAHKAYAYKTLADETSAAPGLRACEKVICIDDLNAYIAAARTAIAGGSKPDVTYDITLE